jgi:hypothetical protein
LAVDSRSGTFVEQPQDDSGLGVGAVERIEIVSTDLVYALRRKELLRYDGQVWTTLPGSEEWGTFTVDRASGRLFAANDADVFVSTDRGQSWRDASVGLPVRPHCTDMRIGNDANGGSTLYLTTYGRSVWRATITLPEDERSNFDLPPQQRELLLRIIEDGGAITRVGRRLVLVPPR